MTLSPPKRAAYGSECSGCGECCVESLCPLGAALFEREDGPCPALGYDKAGKSFCGVIANPASYSPLHTLVYGKDAMSEGAAILVGAGHGCDSCAVGEPYPQSVTAALMAKCSAVPRSAVRRALKLWGLGP